MTSFWSWFVVKSPIFKWTHLVLRERNRCPPPPPPPEELLVPVVWSWEHTRLVCLFCFTFGKVYTVQGRISGIHRHWKKGTNLAESVVVSEEPEILENVDRRIFSVTCDRAALCFSHRTWKTLTLTTDKVIQSLEVAAFLYHPQERKGKNKRPTRQD